MKFEEKIKRKNNEFEMVSNGTPMDRGSHVINTYVTTYVFINNVTIDFAKQKQGERH